MSLSRTFIAGHRRDMGRYPDPKPAGLPGLRIGTTIECFQMDGILQLFRDMLYRRVR